MSSGDAPARMASSAFTAAPGVAASCCRISVRATSLEPRAAAVACSSSKRSMPSGVSSGAVSPRCTARARRFVVRAPDGVSRWVLVSRLRACVVVSRSLVVMLGPPQLQHRTLLSEGRSVPEGGRWTAYSLNRPTAACSSAARAERSRAAPAASRTAPLLFSLIVAICSTLRAILRCWPSIVRPGPARFPRRPKRLRASRC